MVAKSKLRRPVTLLNFTSNSLAIYGHGWAGTRWEQYWKGVLPVDDIALLYSSATAVLGTTESSQRELGMINNRVFEALSCGSQFVSDHFDALEEEFRGLDNIYLVRTTEDVSDALATAKWKVETKKAKGRFLWSVVHLVAHACERVPTHNLPEEAATTREFILRKHTWVHRARAIVNFFDGLVGSAGARPNRPLLSVIYSCESPECGLDLLPALGQVLGQFRELSRTAFRVQVHAIAGTGMESTSTCAATGDSTRACTSVSTEDALHDELQELSLSASDIIVVIASTERSKLSMDLVKAVSPMRPLVSRITESVRSTREYVPREPMRVLVSCSANHDEELQAFRNQYDMLLDSSELSSLTASDLRIQLEDTLHGTRAMAGIKIVKPAASSQIDVWKGADGWRTTQADGSVSSSIFIRVAIDAFRLPDDGMWCLLVQAGFGGWG